MKQTDIGNIAKWQFDIFGDAPQSMRLTRSLLELAEAQAVDNQPNAFVQELADIWITLSGSAVAAGCSNRGVQQIIADHLTPTQPIIGTSMALSLITDSIARWLTLDLRREFVDGFAVEEGEEAVIGYETFWNIVQAARSAGVSFRELLEAIAIKMETNRSRDWDTTQGMSRHV